MFIQQRGEEDFGFQVVEVVERHCVDESCRAQREQNLIEGNRPAPSGIARQRFMNELALHITNNPGNSCPHQSHAVSMGLRPLEDRQVAHEGLNRARRETAAMWDPCARLPPPCVEAVFQ